jgi:prevent-host-death family protein
MTRVPTSQFRDGLAEFISRVAYGGERITIVRNGKGAAALVSVDDAEFLEAMEDRLDLDAARRALREPGSVAWETVKEGLGL